MIAIGDLLRRLTNALLWPFDRLPPALALVLLGAMTGAGMLAVVGVTTPQRRLRIARDRMSAAIYEIRLYLDSPRHIFAAQGRLLLWSGLYLLYLLPAFLVVLPPLALLYPPLEARHGLAPLSPAEPVLLRIELDPAAAAADSTRRLSMLPTPAVQLTAPPVLVRSEAALYLRLQLAATGHHRVVIQTPGWTVDKRITADPLAKSVDGQRRRGLGALLAVGSEPPLPIAGPVRAVTVDHRPRPPRWAGLPWWLLWLTVATATALALRRRVGVTL